MSPLPPSLIVENLKGLVGGPFTFTADAGRCLGIVGASGVGKSLLLRMLADLDESTGVVRLGEATRESMPAPAWRRKVTYLAAEAGWWADTAAAHLTDLVAARALMPELDLAARLLDAPLAQLSTGERQRLALLRALVQQPSFLLLDEPSSALDQVNTSLLEALLTRQMATGLGVVMVSHDVALARRLSDRVLELTREGLR